MSRESRSRDGVEPGPPLVPPGPEEPPSPPPKPPELPESGTEFPVCLRCGMTGNGDICPRCGYRRCASCGDR